MHTHNDYNFANGTQSNVLYLFSSFFFSLLLSSPTHMYLYFDPHFYVMFKQPWLRHKKSVGLSIHTCSQENYFILFFSFDI